MNRVNQTLYPLAVGVSAMILALLGCATPGRNLALGGAVGAGSGAIAGGLANSGRDGQYRTRNVLIGTALGGIAGLVTGALVGDSIEGQKQDAFEKGKASVPKSVASPASLPRLQEPKVEAHWVDTMVIGNRYVEGHWEYQILEPARWEASR